MKKRLIRILIIEDNTDHLELLTQVIERHFAPVDLHTVETVEDAIDFIDQTSYDLIFTDCYIANVSIADQIPFLKNKLGETPLIVITGSGDEGVAADVIKKGATDYLVKTKDSMEKIPAMIKKYLKKQLKKAAEENTEGAPHIQDVIASEVESLNRRAKHISMDGSTFPNMGELESLLDQIQKLKDLATKIKTR